MGFISLLGGEIGGLFVAPECHRSGIGRALLDHVRAQHREALEVEVFADNRLGRAFYARSGFREVAARTHEPTGQKLLRLRLDATRPGHGAGIDSA